MEFGQIFDERENLHLALHFAVGDFSEYYHRQVMMRHSSSASIIGDRLACVRLDVLYEEKVIVMVSVSVRARSLVDAQLWASEEFDTPFFATKINVASAAIVSKPRRRHFCRKI